MMQKRDERLRKKEIFLRKKYRHIRQLKKKIKDNKFF